MRDVSTNYPDDAAAWDLAHTDPDPLNPADVLDQDELRDLWKARGWRRG